MTKTILLVCAVVSVLSACHTLPNSEEPKLPKGYVYIPRAYVSVSCVTHGTGYIHSFYIEEPASGTWNSHRKAGGTNCGGTIAAGYPLPEKWYPGMTVKVRWKPNGREWVEKTTNIMRYEKAGAVTVHFFPNDEVRVVSSSRYSAASPMYPILLNATVPPPEDQ